MHCSCLMNSAPDAGKKKKKKPDVDAGLQNAKQMHPRLCLNLVISYIINIIKFRNGFEFFQNNNSFGKRGIRKVFIDSVF